MKSAMIVGASGLVGGLLLELLLDADEYSQLFVVGRRSLNRKHPKIKEKIIDFDKISKLDINERIDDLFITLGTTIKKAGSKAEFYKTDHDFVVNFAEWAQTKGVNKILIVSSMGANHNSGNFYLKTKGEMEISVLQIGIESVFIFRPSLLVGARKEFRLGEKFGAWVMKIINPLLTGKYRRYRSINASQVALAMYHTAQTKGTKHYIMESDEMQLM